MSDRTIEYDLKFLLAVLNWAARSRDEEGRLLLESNPLRGLKTPRQKNPARVLLTDAEYQAMLRASLLMDWRFRVALVIAHETGHRIGAIRQLRWSAIDMEGRTIRWRAEHEKTGHEHRTPVTAEALDAPKPNVPARTRTWGLLLRRRTKGDANQGKESAKSNWDCTICRSCRWGGSGLAGPKERENGGKWRDSCWLRLATRPTIHTD